MTTKDDIPAELTVYKTAFIAFLNNQYFCREQDKIVPKPQHEAMLVRELADWITSCKL